MGTPRGEHTADGQARYGQVIAQAAGDLHGLGGIGFEFGHREVGVVSRQAIPIAVAGYAPDEHVVAATVKELPEFTELYRAAGNAVHECHRPGYTLAMLQEE